MSAAMTVTMVNPSSSAEGTTRQLSHVVVEAGGVRVKTTASGRVTVSTRRKEKKE